MTQPDIKPKQAKAYKAGRARGDVTAEYFRPTEALYVGAFPNLYDELKAALREQPDVESKAYCADGFLMAIGIELSRLHKVNQEACVLIRELKAALESEDD